MNTSKVASALNTLSLGIAELAEALSDGTAPVLAPLAADEEVPEFPPIEYEALPIPADAPSLGKCPFHGTTWTVKAAGVSKTGKSYRAFWKCDGKDPDGTFCNRKPVKAWADAHPIAA